MGLLSVMDIIAGQLSKVRSPDVLVLNTDAVQVLLADTRLDLKIGC